MVWKKQYQGPYLFTSSSFPDQGLLEMDQCPLKSLWHRWEDNIPLPGRADEAPSPSSWGGGNNVSYHQSLQLICLLHSAI